jgi:uncharacterized zinc-type alcohol dehydrogenase-like protein
VSRGLAKKESSLALGADAYIDSNDSEAMKAAACSFDFMLNTIAAPHNVITLINMLTLDGLMVMVGAGSDSLPVSFGALLMKRRRIAGSLIGGIKETQEMLDFCGDHGIVCDIETIPADAEAVNVAYDRAVKGDVKYRFVIDTSTF